MVVPDLARAAVALTHAATALATFKAGPQSVEGYVAEYDNLLSSLFRKAWRGDITAGEMATEHKRILRNLAPGCYYAGMQDGGVEQSEADETDRQTIADWIAEQSSRVRDFAKAAVDAGKDKAAREQIQARADLWLAAMLALGNLGRASAQSNTMGEWVYGDTDHCDTCAGLNGKRHRLKWFTSRGYIPREPGSRTLDCHGFRCQCRIIDAGGKQLM